MRGKRGTAGLCKSRSRRGLTARMLLVRSRRDADWLVAGAFRRERRRAASRPGSVAASRAAGDAGPAAAGDVVLDMPGICAVSRASGLRWSCSGFAVAAVVIANATSRHAMVEPWIRRAVDVVASWPVVRNRRHTRAVRSTPAPCVWSHGAVDGLVERRTAAFDRVWALRPLTLAGGSGMWLAW